MKEYIDESLYIKHGYDSREHYLRELADEHEVSVETVKQLASVLGPNEDFDGLVSELEDAAQFGLFDFD